MDKIAAYEELIYKEASRAWKRELGTLSDLARRELVKKNILNYNRELKGLEKGTKAIAKDYKVKTTSNPLTYGKALFKDIHKPNAEYVAEQKFKSKGINPAEKALKVNFEAASRSISGVKDGAGSVSKSRVAYAPSKSKIDQEFADNVYQKEHVFSMSKPVKKDFDKWNKAISLRHEVDENRATQQVEKKLKNKKNGMIKHDFRPEQIGNSAHVSPKVIARESANVAVAPLHTRNFYKALRATSGETADPKYLKMYPGAKKFQKGKTYETYGLKYGDSGVYDKKLADQMEKQVAEENFKKRAPIVASKNVSDYVSSLFGIKK
ncbi:MAG: hypothetical protein K0R00_30 [Herbinix sp.]|jgi:hypothetical protein|nr:hypothetical protein [Herbinix sp.]